jgi:hypothetical protein
MGSGGELVPSNAGVDAAEAPPQPPRFTEPYNQISLWRERTDIRNLPEMNAGRIATGEVLLQDDPTIL